MYHTPEENQQHARRNPGNRGAPDASSKNQRRNCPGIDEVYCGDDRLREGQHAPARDSPANRLAGLPKNTPKRYWNCSNAAGPSSTSKARGYFFPPFFLAAAFLAAFLAALFWRRLLRRRLFGGCLCRRFLRGGLFCRGLLGGGLLGRRFLCRSFFRWSLLGALARAFAAGLAGAFTAAFLAAGPSWQPPGWPSWPASWALRPRGLWRRSGGAGAGGGTSTRQPPRFLPPRPLRPRRRIRRASRSCPDFFVVVVLKVFHIFFVVGSELLTIKHYERLLLSGHNHP